MKEWNWQKNGQCTFLAQNLGKLVFFKISILWTFPWFEKISRGQKLHQSSKFLFYIPRIFFFLFSKNTEDTCNFAFFPPSFVYNQTFLFCFLFFNSIVQSIILERFLRLLMHIILDILVHICLLFFRRTQAQN